MNLMKCRDIITISGVDANIATCGICERHILQQTWSVDTKVLIVQAPATVAAAGGVPARARGLRDRHHSHGGGEEDGGRF